MWDPNDPKHWLDSRFDRTVDRELTARLYGGDNRTRIRQELVSGVGGMRALKALGITPGVYHLNEGHSAFATLEAIRERMKEDGTYEKLTKKEVAGLEKERAAQYERRASARRRIA